MRKLLAVLVLAVPLAAGCSCPVRYRAFVEGTETYAREILPEYKKYIENDPNLKPETKTIRLRTAEEFEKLIEEGKKDSKE